MSVAAAMKKAFLVAALAGVGHGANVQAQSNVTIGAYSGEAERARLADWMAQTKAVLHSPEFAANLRSVAATYPQVYLDHDFENKPILATVQRVLDILQPVAGFRYVNVPVALVGGTGDEAAYAGWTGYYADDGFSLGSMTIGRRHMARWMSNDAVERSCAVNTMAHEMSHTISVHENFYIMAFRDQDRRKAPASVPAASYMIGTAAQCTWLQQQGRLPANGFGACLAVFGTRHFNSNRCPSFADGQPVKERPDLPAPATD
jgi:hypothetical protein